MEIGPERLEETAVVEVVVKLGETGGSRRACSGRMASHRDCWGRTVRRYRVAARSSRMIDHDRRSTLVGSYENAAVIVSGIDAGALGHPTPCRKYDVAGLVDVTREHRSASMGKKAGCVSLPLGGPAGTWLRGPERAPRIGSDELRSAGSLPGPPCGRGNSRCGCCNTGRSSQGPPLCCGRRGTARRAALDNPLVSHRVCPSSRSRSASI